VSCPTSGSRSWQNLLTGLQMIPTEALVNLNKRLAIV
jgi:hypothetical protein